MIAFLRHVLSANYLYALHPVPAGLASVEFAVWTAALFALSLGAGLWQRTRIARNESAAAPRFMLALLLAAWIALGAQALSDGPLSARIWTLTLVGMALAVPLTSWLAGRRCRAELWPILGALACAVHPNAPVLSPGATIAWLLGHALALGSALALSFGENRAGQEPLAILLALVAGVAALVASACATRSTSPTGIARHRLRVEMLAPLLLPYLVLRLQWFVSHTLGVDTGAYLAFPYPDLWSPWFDPAIPWLIAAAWMLLSAAAYLRRAHPRSERWMGRLATVTLLTWLSALLVRHLSHGAGGSDPFAYLQMAADLARSGDLRHAFPLVSVAAEASVPLWPLVPVGYHPPLSGVAATVWPPGWPVLLAAFYRIGGEAFALWGAPLCLLLSAWLTYLLARQLRSATAFERRSGVTAGAMLAAALLLTSYEALTRALVPMADAAATACALLTFLALLRARTTDRLRWSATAGLALALAYTVRHPLLPLALAALPGLLAAPAVAAAPGVAAAPVVAAGPWPLRRRLAHLALFGTAALAGALPDLWYHNLAFGSPWTSESAEWFLLSPGNILGTLSALWRSDLLRRNEFGYLWPLIALGLGAALRNRPERTTTAILLTGAAGVLLFHLGYEALRLRDLMPLFPVLAVWAARGARSAWVWACHGPHPMLRRSAVTLALLLLLLARSTDTLTLPLHDRVQTYGHLTAAQHDAYVALGAALPESAVVGTAASAGPVLRYAGCQIVRPAAWSAEEFARFVHALKTAGRELYLLGDGEEMAAWLPTLEGRYSLTMMSEWLLPLYGLGGQPLPGAAQLYLLQRR